ncbi:hypothetical protein DFP72DRAFT_855585 [Ephemerocybe angulata]|uniref:Uncharacterized protein n=1 Tax=Ephemerocybe angulata TaxID=980116 RepID=A0A8H6HH25_9AGAR|nr:hypothetical protein DFP72DRAFT_855585 [Tulosesus angulatus]
MRPRSLSCLHPQRLSNLLVTLTYGLHHFKTMQERSERQDTSRSREFDPLLLHRRRSYLHIHVQLSPPFPCHDDPILMSLSLAPTLSFMKGHTRRLLLRIQAAALSLARSRYFDHTPLAGTFCCVFVIQGALTCFQRVTQSCRRTVCRRQIHCAFVNPRPTFPRCFDILRLREFSNHGVRSRSTPAVGANYHIITAQAHISAVGLADEMLHAIRSLPDSDGPFKTNLEFGKRHANCLSQRDTVVCVDVRGPKRRVTRYGTHVPWAEKQQGVAVIAGAQTGAGDWDSGRFAPMNLEL